MIDAVLFGFLAAAAYFDWRRRKVPNMLTLPLMIAGLLYQWHFGSGWLAVMGIAAAFLLTLGLVACKGMGMGDQKLLMAVGAWGGWTDVCSLFLYSILLGLLVITLHPRIWARLWGNMRVVVIGWRAHQQLWLPGPGETAFSFPYAVLLLGAFLAQQIRSTAGFY